MGKYFNLGNAWNDLKNSYGAGETAIAALKLVGKGISNTAVYGVTEFLPAAAKEIAQKNSATIDDKLKNDSSLTFEERAALEKKKNKSDIYLKISDLKEKVEKLNIKLSSEQTSDYEKPEVSKKIEDLENQILTLQEEYRELDS